MSNRGRGTESREFIDRQQKRFLGLVSLVSCLVILANSFGNRWGYFLGGANIAQAQTSPAQLLSLYQPIQNIVWEGQFVSPKGITYFSNTGEPQIAD